MTAKTPRMVQCQKTNQEAEGLRRPPVAGELGKRIYNSISKAAWQEWLKRQTMFINEYRLNLTDDEAQAFLQKQMQEFLFSDKDTLPEGFQKPQA